MNSKYIQAILGAIKKTQSTEQTKIHLRWQGLESQEILRIFTPESAIRGTQRLFSVKYLFGEPKIA